MLCLTLSLVLPALVFAFGLPLSFCRLFRGKEVDDAEDTIVAAATTRVGFGGRFTLEEEEEEKGVDEDRDEEDEEEGVDDVDADPK